MQLIEVIVVGAGVDADVDDDVDIRAPLITYISLESWFLRRAFAAMVTSASTSRNGCCTLYAES